MGPRQFAFNSSSLLEIYCLYCQDVIYNSENVTWARCIAYQSGYFLPINPYIPPHCQPRGPEVYQASGASAARQDNSGVIGSMNNLFYQLLINISTIHFWPLSTEPLTANWLRCWEIITGRLSVPVATTSSLPDSGSWVPLTIWPLFFGLLDLGSLLTPSCPQILD